MTAFHVIGDRLGAANIQLNLGELHLFWNDLTTARSHIEAGTALANMLGDAWLQTCAQHSQGLLAYYMGDSVRAMALLEKSAAFTRNIGDHFGLAETLVIMGQLVQAQGDMVCATHLFTEGLSLYRHMTNRRGIARCLEGLASLAVVEGQPERAAQLFGAAEAIRNAIGAPLPPVERANYERNLASVQAQCDAALFAAAWAVGQAMTMEQVIADVLSATAPAPAHSQPQ
jgi:hypothetical protein